MIEVYFYRQHHDSWCLFIGVELERLSVPCAPDVKEPTLSLCVGILRWSFYITIYKPAGV